MQQRHPFRTWFVAVLGCEAVGILGSVFTSSAIPAWYAALEKPWFQPPNWVFGPVWTALYALMGTAVWLIWQALPAGIERRSLVLLFLIQLALNGIWTPVFFGLKMLGPALGIIVVLWVAILITAWRFWRVKPAAGALLIPYILWVSFAAVLNGALWRLNPVWR